MVEKNNKNNKTGISSSFVNASKKRKKQKIVFGILTLFLAVGLIGSSLIMALPGFQSKEANVEQKLSVEQKITELESKLKEDPNNTVLLGQLAELFSKNNNYPKALENYNKALEINPKDVELYKDLGLTYFLIGEYDNAIAQMQESLKIKPDDAYAHYYIGQVYAFRSDEGRDIAKGIEGLEEFVRLQKDGPDVENAKQYIEELKTSQKS